MSNLLTIKLDGVDKTSYALMDSFKLNLKTNDFNTLSIKFKDIHIEPTTPGAVVLIKVILNATGATLFDGHVHDAVLEFYKLDGDITTCQCVDAVAAGQLYGNTTTGDYTAGDHTEKQILTEFFDAQGWVPNPVGAHAITGVLPSIKFNMSSMKRAIDDLAAVNSRLWYWDGDRELHYFASTGEVAPFNFSDTPNNTTTFLYGKLRPKLSKDGVWNTSGGSLICWQDGLRAGMAITITNAHLGWVARSFIINEVEMRYAGGNILNVDKFEYTINFGDVKKPRVTDYIVRSSQNVSTVDRGLVPPLENDTTKFLRSDGVYAAASGSVPKLDDCLAPDDNTDLNASTTKHGLLPKLGGGTVNFLRADGAWAAPGGMSSHALDGSTYHSAPTDITTYNASTAAHGFLKKLDNNAANFMNGQGNWAVPAGGTPATSVQDERSYGQVPIVGVSANYARQDHTHGSPAVVGTSMSTFTTAQRPSSGIQTNGGNIRVVIFYLRITNMTQIFSAYVNGTLAAQAQVTSGSDGAGFTFVVGKNQQYYVVYGGGTQANWQWTELDITNI